MMLRTVAARLRWWRMTMVMTCLMKFSRWSDTSHKKKKKKCKRSLKTPLSSRLLTHPLLKNHLHPLMRNRRKFFWRFKMTTSTWASTTRMMSSSGLTSPCLLLKALWAKSRSRRPQTFRLSPMPNLKNFNLWSPCRGTRRKTGLPSWSPTVTYMQRML